VRTERSSILLFYVHKSHKCLQRLTHNYYNSIDAAVARDDFEHCCLVHIFIVYLM